MTDSPPILRKQCVVGAPVSCLSLPSKSLVVYNQGGWLERRALGVSDDSTPTCGSSQDRILALDDGNIHGIRYSPNKKLSSVFGANHVAFLRHVLDIDIAMIKISSIRQGDHQSNTQLVASDWIWDCHWQDDSLLVVGLAHNKVQLWELHENPDDNTLSAVCRREFVGPTRTISYCMHIHGSLIAVGLPLRDILVWSMDDETHKEAILHGHAGCIHSIRFKHQNLLASASDDRTVRLWERQTMTGQWTLKWTAWGHKARCWSVAFSDLGVVSTGEDATAIVWDQESGVQLAVLRGHACQSIWRVDTCEFFAVTGANDGSVSLYDLRHQIRRQRTQGMDEPTCSWEDIILVPNGIPLSRTFDGVNEAADAPLTEVNTTKRKTKEKQQALVGFECSRHHGSALRLVVATRSGMILSFELETVQYDQVAAIEWWDESLAAHGISPMDGCCFSLCPTGCRGLVGTVKGDILLVDLIQGSRELIGAKQHRAVQRLVWLNPSSFVSLHIQTIIIWSEMDKSRLSTGQFSMRHVFTPKLKGMAICSCLDDSQTLLVSGDTRGYLAVFEVPLNVDANSEIPPASTLRAHGREHVTAVVWVQERILSTGNDGCIHESMLLSNKTLVALKSVSVSSFSGLDRIWVTPCVTGYDVLVGGYYGNTYAVVDASTGYEVLRSDTGGRQRSTSLFLDWSNVATANTLNDGMTCSPPPLTRTCWFAVAGGHDCAYKEIQLTRNLLLGHGGAWRCAIAAPMHGDVIFDCCLFALNSDMIGLATASEDCYSRIAWFRDGCLLSSDLLPAQAGGVRAISHCRMTNTTTLLAAGGGKLELQFYVVHDLTSASYERPRVEHIGSARPSKEASIDHRINAVAVAKHPAVDAGALIAAGDSNGSVHLYAVPGEHRGAVQGSSLFCGDRPVLSLKFIATERYLLLLIGTTNGDVTIVDIGGAVVLSYEAHQMGTNAIDARYITDDSGQDWLRICSGGDDQIIHSCQISVDHGSSSLSLTTPQQAKTLRCASAIRGLAFVDDEHVATCGYDRQVRLISVSDGRIDVLTSNPITPGDINCLAHVPFGDSHRLAICGAGIEIYDININT